MSIQAARQGVRVLVSSTHSLQEHQWRGEVITMNRGGRGGCYFKGLKITIIIMGDKVLA